MIEGITHEPDDQYQAVSKAGKAVSSHMLARFRDMPYKYWATVSGLYHEPDNRDFAFGRAAHKLILEGRDAFNTAYVVSDGPTNPRTGKAFGADSKAYAEWAAEQSGEIVSAADFEVISAMKENVCKHPDIPKLLGHGEAECVVRAELCGMPCQIRMDYFDPQVGIVDLKTCRDIKFFEYDARNMGYGFQLAFYRAVLAAATGLNYPCYMIAVDKTDFHVAGYWQVPEAELDKAAAINTAALKRLKECTATGLWPTGYERKQVFEIFK